MSDKIWSDIDIINIQFKYLNTDTVYIEYSTQIRTDLNLYKRIRSRIRSKNIRTIFISILSSLLPAGCKEFTVPSSSSHQSMYQINPNIIQARATSRVDLYMSNVCLRTTV